MIGYLAQEAYYERFSLLQNDPFGGPTGGSEKRGRHIGNYDSCLSYSEVTGCWRPLAGSNPYLGEENIVSAEPELKVEVTCLREKAAPACGMSMAHNGATRST